LVHDAPEYYMGMGHTAEEVAKRFSVTREEQDAFAVLSHERAGRAIREGKFIEEIVPVKVINRFVGKDNKMEQETIIFDTDEGVRPETTMGVLSKLRPAFKRFGSVTAGNTSQMS